MIRELDLEQIEADVVIVLYNHDLGCHRIIPYWECGIPAKELMTHATREALTFAEQCGGGYVDFHIRDFRGEGIDAPASIEALNGRRREGHLMAHYAIRRGDTRELFAGYTYAPGRKSPARWVSQGDECYCPCVFRDGPNSPDAQTWIEELQDACPGVPLIWVEVSISG